MKEFSEGKFDIVVVGAGHAGCEAALAGARTGLTVALLTLNLDSIAFMACNPSIGGTAKGHLVREIDALGGEMGINADKTSLQMRMLNVGKGAAVQSLRCQSDKNAYHTQMKKTLERTPNLSIFQGEAEKVLVEEGKVVGLKTTYGGVFTCKAVILATGVYLNAETITGEVKKKSGPNGFAPATELTKNLIELGYNVRRFKTGTPARVHSRTIDYSKMIIQEGEELNYSFSFMTPYLPANVAPCYLTYTNEETHRAILDHLDRSPLYNGDITSTGPRYCPSIETKVVRFADKDRHQLFVEPEGVDTLEMYIQGMSTSMPHDIQQEMYHSIAGLENCHIMRYAYAIEYDCIDTLDLYPTLEFKKVEGLYTAGQINGTSGYEEAAAQGLMAGINASLKIRGKAPFILGRDEAYIGVLIDDLVTKGTEEPYRMMTSRAEHRLLLRQDNADLRLTQKGFDCGLVTQMRYMKFLDRKLAITSSREALTVCPPLDLMKKFVKLHNIKNYHGLHYDTMVLRGFRLKELCSFFNILEDLSNDVIETIEVDIRYSGYLKRGQMQIDRAKKMEGKELPRNLNYNAITGLRLEAREKLSKIRPENLGQASRISGVTPADIIVLMIFLESVVKI